ncbi:hypothetical protein OUZ56_021967 [Daphnia magna]|uniref:Uncharacterized protein n=1 Tax=Daphnia magna TaxID=35525 RepID=A0ABR0AV78_9CRUS|nr:hypothetical protein OUZ56_021967 [Daphnia magna]
MAGTFPVIAPPALQRANLPSRARSCTSHPNRITVTKLKLMLRTHVVPLRSMIIKVALIGESITRPAAVT